MDALQLIAEPRRREILALIWDDEMAVSAIAERVDVSVAAISQHLARLRAVGLVEMRPEGKRRYYRADRKAFGAMAPMLELMWRQDIDRLAHTVERGRRRR